MNNIIENLDKLLESRVRLGIMSVLTVNESVDFNSLKQMLNITDGNLASHISALEKAKYIKIKKKIIKKKTNTTYTISEQGKKAFLKHLEGLEKLINNK
ncbi:MAG TPA: transcriptional regulator [Ignavibacteria bacterium]|nr:transcriptional regulator [Ignavibacteria bacterium]HMR40845.1 transcriptional regulator [Ignavibacteria bacterium]